MPSLKHVATGKSVPLAEETLIGRSDRALLVLEDPRVSEQHALMKWKGGQWHIRDLGSRNGTRIGKLAIGTGEWLLVVDGQRLRFGSPEQAWEFVGGGRPEPIARNEETGEFYVGASGAIELPGQALLETDSKREYVCTSEDEQFKVTDGSRVILGSVPLRFFLPDPRPDGAFTEAAAILPAELDLELIVSLDQEHIELRLSAPDCSQSIPPHAEHTLLLELARARLRDRENGVPTSEQGWCYCEVLREELKLSRHHFNIQIHRLRARFAEAHISDPAEVIERRAGNHSLRLNAHRIRVSGAGALLGETAV